VNDPSAESGTAGVGIDCEEVERWRMLVASSAADLEALFAESERTYCQTHGAAPERYATCWSGKEAVCKALAGHMALTPRDVRLEFDERGVPAAVLPSGVCAELRVQVSLSCSGSLAVAVAVVIAGAGESPRQVV